MNEVNSSAIARIQMRLTLCFLFIAATFVGCNPSEKRSAEVTLNQSENKIEMSNGKVQLILTLDSARVAQRFYARFNDEWKLVSSSFNLPAKTNPNVIPLYKKGQGVAEE